MEEIYLNHSFWTILILIKQKQKKSITIAEEYEGMVLYMFIVYSGLSAAAE